MCVFFFEPFLFSTIVITPHSTYPSAIRSKVPFAPRVVALSIQEPGASSSLTSKLKRKKSELKRKIALTTNYMLRKHTCFTKTRLVNGQ